ncbi:MAG: hypothetical protein VXX15_07885 [Planctomycetota bacterium]|nr:hypothetical protein [Planctomycetota bacterium]
MNESWSMPATEVLFLLAGLLLTMVVVAVVGTMLFRAYRAEMRAEAKAAQNDSKLRDDQSEDA